MRQSAIQPDLPRLSHLFLQDTWLSAVRSAETQISPIKYVYGLWDTSNIALGLFIILKAHLLCFHFGCFSQFILPSISFSFHSVRYLFSLLHFPSITLAVPLSLSLSIHISLNTRSLFRLKAIAKTRERKKSRLLFTANWYPKWDYDSFHLQINQQQARMHVFHTIPFRLILSFVFIGGWAPNKKSNTLFTATLSCKIQ